MSDVFTNDDYRLFERILFPHQPIMNEASRKIRAAYGRPMTDLERRWFSAKQRGERLKPRTVQKIPFPEEP